MKFLQKGMKKTDDIQMYIVKQMFYIQMFYSLTKQITINVSSLKDLDSNWYDTEGGGLGSY